MKKRLIQIGLVVLAIAIVFGGYTVYSKYINPPLVEYKVDGTAKEALIIVLNGNGETEYFTGVSLSRSYTYKEFEGTELSVSAQNEGDQGSVRVTIYYKGKRVAQHAATGQNALASADYTIPPTTATVSP